MSKFFEKNLSIVLLAISSYFLFSISNSFKDSGKYYSDLRACAKMKAYINDKESSKLYQQKAAINAGVEINYISEYCKKLTQQNIF